MTKRAGFKKTEDPQQSEVFSEVSTKNNYNVGKWSVTEHERFMQAIELYGNQWKKVKDHVGTRSCAQIRSHCQKFFRRKRNMLYQELRRTNSHKKMRFLVVKEYYNYANPTNRHKETVKEESKKESEVEEEVVREEPVVKEPVIEEPIAEVINVLEPPYLISDVVKIEELPEESDDFLFVSSPEYNSPEKDSYICSLFESDFLLEDTGLNALNPDFYELSNNLPPFNHP